MLKRWIVFGCLVLAACANPLVRQLHGSLAPPPGMAYALVSLTASGPDTDDARLNAQFRREDGPPSGRNAIHADLATDTVFSRQVGGPMANGRLTLLTLAPGRYAFYAARGYYRDGFLFMHPTVWRHFRTYLPFQVAAGEVVYLGNIHLDLSYLPELTVRDSRERDLGHVARIWQVGDLSPVRVRLLVAPPAHAPQ